MRFLLPGRRWQRLLPIRRLPNLLLRTECHHRTITACTALPAFLPPASRRAVPHLQRCDPDAECRARQSLHGGTPGSTRVLGGHRQARCFAYVSPSALLCLPGRWTCPRLELVYSDGEPRYRSPHLNTRGSRPDPCRFVACRR